MRRHLFTAVMCAGIVAAAVLAADVSPGVFLTWGLGVFVFGCGWIAGHAMGTGQSHRGCRAYQGRLRQRITFLERVRV